MHSKDQKRRHFDDVAADRAAWMERNPFYHRDLATLVGTIVPPGSTVLELGSGLGDLLAGLKPARGVGLDLSPEMVRRAQERHPSPEGSSLEFRVADAEALQGGETFDYVILSDLIGELTDIWAAFRGLQQVTHPGSRVVITYFNALWEPLLRAGEELGLKMPQDRQNWLSMDDIQNLLDLNGFEVVKRGHRQLVPKDVPGVAPLFNNLVAKLPGVESLCLVVYLVARPRPQPQRQDYSVSVIIPCRNERGNIRAAVERVPDMGTHTEIIFVDGNSNDGTVEEIEKVIAEFGSKRDLRLIHQVEPGSADGAGHGKMLKLGKGDAVRKGFAAAKGEILMILDADLTVPPEDLPKFYLALAERRGEFVNGTRLVYPMEEEAMRFLNKLANKSFGALFTWLCDQRLKDTLCGTKVLFKKDYEKIVAGRAYFGDFDPFGDFDLLFGATRQNLKIVEVPVRYLERTYGEVKIERFRHGLLLLKMSGIALAKLKMQ
jgi:SAM-dependent methyltransferase